MAQPAFGQIVGQARSQTIDQTTGQTTGQTASDLMPSDPPIPPLPNSARSLPAPAPALRPRYPSDASFLLPPRPIFPEVQSTELRLVLRLSDRRVYLYRGDDVEVSYPVAVGKGGWETPTGSYEVMTMIEHPSWENPFTGGVIPAGPDNPLGERWIGFWTDGRNFIGFHGTPNEGSVGRAASHGCVRMYNRDIRELFTLVAVGTSVAVEP
ncbi:MAG: L,D-transpeptidase [Elainellaceae cyanobacterium]